MKNQFWFYFSFVVCLLFFFAGIFSYSLLSFIKNHKSNESVHSHEYQYLQINIHTNDTFSGFFSSPHETLDCVKEYISYQDEETLIYSLISNFGNEEYQCTGSCFCDNSIQRRATKSILSKGIIYFLAALSSVVAYREATEYFDELCKDQYSESCSVESIRSEVDECKPVIRRRREEKSESNYEEKYLCSGKCLKNTFKEEKPKSMVTKFGCDRLKLEAFVTVDPTSKIEGSKKGGGHVFHQMRRTAIKTFQRDHLTAYCKKYSVEEYEYFEYKLIKGGVKTGPFRKKKKVSLCTARRGPLNPTINCKQL